jgi:hypothetical protein
VEFSRAAARRRRAEDPGGLLVGVMAVARFAEKHRTELKDNWVYAERLGGFCLLTKRAVLDKIDKALDEWTDLSLFDSRHPERQGHAGGAVCRDLFVHHIGTWTFAHWAMGPVRAKVP